MKRLPRLLSFLFLALISVFSALAADVAVKGYTKKDGTYVAPHVRTAPNSTKNDNYSTKGNVNPNTGKAGTKPGDTVIPAPRTQAAPAPRSVAAAPAPSTSSGSSALKQPGNLEPWKKLHLGMTPAEVSGLVGEPSMKTSTKWVYTSVGATVTFVDGKVSGLSLPSVPDREEPPPMMTMEEIQTDGKGNQTVKKSSTIRSGVVASLGETNLAMELVQDGWIYVMPEPKSAQAAWGNKDGRTTWFRGYWKNTITGQLSAGTPVRDGNVFRGDGAAITGAWSNGGAPIITKLQWLASKSGGPPPSLVR